MSDEAFLNLGKDNSTNSDPQLTHRDLLQQRPLQTNNTQQRIIERTLHTIHTIRLYPNGEIYVNKSVSWLDKKGTVVKKKKEKKIVKPKKSVLQQEESY